MSNSRVKIKVVVIAESEEDSAAEDDIDLLKKEEALSPLNEEKVGQKRGKVVKSARRVLRKRRSSQMKMLPAPTTAPSQLNGQKTSKEMSTTELEMGEQDDLWPVAVETSVSDDQGIIVRKQLHVELLAHCIFCLRKTAISGDSVPIGQERSEDEMLQVVPRAQPPSCLSSFLNSFNRIWSDFQKMNGNDMPGDSRRSSRGEQSVRGLNFLDLPRICEFCAQKMETVHKLYQKLNAELEVLRNIIAESKNSGRYSWAQQFERTLSSSNLERGVIDATTDLLDKLRKVSAIPTNNDPLSGLEDDLQSDTIYAAEPLPREDSSSLTVQTQQRSSSLSESNSSSNESSQDDDHADSDFDGSEDFLFQEAGSNDNQADADWIKSEPEDSSSDNVSSSEEEETSPRRGRSSKRQSSLPTSSKESSARKTDAKQTKSTKWPIPDSHTRSGQNERLALRKRMEQAKAFSTSVDPATGKEVFHCQLDGCTASFKLWGSLFNHQGPNHNPNNVCASCGKAFRTSSQLQTYKQRTQCDKWKQACDLCKKEIPLAEIYKHVQGHVGDEYLLKCPNPECRHVYSNTVSLREHTRYNSASSTPAKFRTCSKTIPNFTEYFESFHVCQVCGLNANNGNSLRGHLHRVHENASQKNFPCPIKGCPHQFTVRQSVVCHLLKHDIIPDVQNCSQCGVTFQFEQMEEHLKECHGAEEVFKCIHCPFLFSAREFMLDHLSEHNKKEDLLFCDICRDSLKFARYSSLREHYFSKHGVGRKHPCAKCGHVSWSQHLATLHAKEKHGVGDDDGGDASDKITRHVKREKPCDLCDAVFSSTTKLRDHKMQAHGAAPYRCQQCDASFSSSALFWQHEREHHGRGQGPEQEFPCDVPDCGKVFKHKTTLREHVSSVHFGEKHVCEVCAKPFGRAKSLKKHMHCVHLRIRPFVCEVCGSSFISKSKLKAHKIVHCEDRPHGCPMCNKKFKRKYDLGTHLKSHRNKKPRLPRRKRAEGQPKEFRCDAGGCGKVYKQKKGLLEHTLSAHLGQKHVCELCGKSYSYSMGLKNHVDSFHLGLKSFVCETCGESFSSGGLLRRHNLIHSGERPFSCDICGQRFRQREVLATHLASHRSKGADFKPTGPMKHIRKRVQRKKAPSP